MILSNRAKLRDGRLQRHHLEAERLRCLGDACYFINTYLMLRDSTGTPAPMSLWSIQEVLVALLSSCKNVIIKNPRRAGISTMLMGYLVWESIFLGSSKQRVVISPNSIMARHNYEVFQDLLASVPRWFNVHVASSSNMTTLLTNGTTISFVGAHASNAHGFMPDTLVFPDFAFMDPSQQNAMLMTYGPYLSYQTKMIFASTPSTGHDTFAGLWQRAINCTIPLEPLSVSFWDLPNATQTVWDHYVAQHGLFNTRRDLGAEFPT